ncbi:RagB/SusD family nutrient uptake outer membrane protein [Cellulophaga sp. 20_2_10]|uniref:RagB/SusD family nutrient uptake outer membrane protein n=1 Tax=Cellulophaga sp. 20_2_10 TaxID=2942476 RepID=UPI00201B1D00|nr:RagB/SusD family nutrient uptake outer membrane protein [Cellulophaga sp. 20_2_10]MCL5246123.1 RagB/SusD family nutrient uptake outer membrane protein [Cellulophaga sp. 20_2_10]
MKTLYIKFYASILGIALVSLTSCEVANELDSFDPLYVLEAEEAINSPVSAELALTGAYSKMSSGFDGRPWLTTVPALMSFTAVPTAQTASNVEIAGFEANNPLKEGFNLKSMYTHLYEQINRANWIIEKVTELPDTGFEAGRRLGIVAEAKAIRAQANFELLRLWGQFYDLNSEYGVNIRLSPAKTSEVLPRGTVMEAYTAILNDLNDVIANAPDLRDGHKYYMNKTFGKSLKAKVLLFMGRYAEAATLASEVINSSDANFKLTPTFNELFDHSSIATLDNSESIFAVYSDPSEGTDNNLQWWLYNSISPNYINWAAAGTTTIAGQEISFDGNRVAGMQGFFGFNSKYNNLFLGESFDTVYFMRMAEVYLIFAEADARATNSVSTAALNALNDIRVRAGATTTGADGFETYPASITLPEFLEAVRVEKAMELATELGETWFDLIRYDYIDGFDAGFKVSDHKPTATNPDKFILPIPLQSVEVSNNVVLQNPSY